MDDSRFDRILKEKLDQYEDPSFDPAALEGFHSKLSSGFSSGAPVSWYSQPFTHYLVAASLTAFTIVNAYLFWPEKKEPTITTAQFNRQQQSLDSLTKAINGLQLQLQPLLAAKENEQLQNSGVEKAASVVKNPNQANQRDRINQAEHIVESSQKPNQSPEKVRQVQEQTALQKTAALQKSSERNLLAHDGLKANERGSLQTVPTDSVDKTTTQVAKVDAVLPTVSLPTSANATVVDSTLQEPILAAQQVVKDSAQQTKDEIADPPKPATIIKRDPSKYSGSKWALMAGAGIDAGATQLGFSALGGIVLKDRWELAAGIKFLNLDNEQFRDPADFKDRKKRDFSSTFDHPIPNPSQVSDIEVKSSLIQIPLSLSYRLPLNNRFGLLFGAGTDLDISGNLQIDYHDMGPGPGPSPRPDQNFTAKPALPVFNNVSLQAGAQLKVNRFVIQASPFVNAQVTPVVYRREEFYYGLRLRAFFNF